MKKKKKKKIEILTLEEQKIVTGVEDVEDFEERKHLTFIAFKDSNWKNGGRDG